MKKHSWVDCLPEVLNWYNNEHIHRTTKLTPRDASLEENQDKLKLRYKEIRSIRLPESQPLEVNTFCRIFRWKSSRFAKGSEKNWSSEIFRIKSRNNNHNPVTYQLEDESGDIVRGNFYSKELLPSAFSF